MAWYDKEEHIRKVMELPDLPAAFRKYLLQATLYTLRQMPDDPVLQRKIMLEQDTQTHYDNGNERIHRSAQFRETLHPNIVSLPETIVCIAQTTHDITEDPECYRNTDKSSITAEVIMEAKFLAGSNVTRNEMFFLSLKLEKFWRTVAAEAGLVQNKPNLIPQGQFNVRGCSFAKQDFSAAPDEAQSLQFHYGDYKKVIAALEKMLLAIDAEIETETASHPTRKIFAKIGISTDSSTHMQR